MIPAPDPAYALRRMLVIRTPEGIAFPLQLADPLARFMALTLDMICIYVVSGLFSFVVRLAQFISTDFAIALWMLTSFALFIAYPMVLEWFWRGQTLGKRIMKIRVMDEQGLRLRFSQIALRNIVRFVDALPLFYGVGGAASLLSSRAQRIGDLAAGTIVVQLPRLSEPDLSQVLSGKFNSFRAYPHLAARLRQNVSPAEAGVALRAVLRRDAIEAEPRLRLFAELRSHLESKATFPAEVLEGLSDEQYVRNAVDLLFR